MFVTTKPTLAQEYSVAENTGSEEFIRLCLSSRWKPSNLSKAADVYNAAGFDWPPVISLAQKEHTSPLMYRSLRDEMDVRPDILQIFQADYLWWARRNLLTFHELGILLQALAENEIPIILLKGAALAEELYGNIALRPIRDIDVLVHPKNRRSTIKLLKPLNYTTKEIEVHDASTFEYENEIILVKPGLPETYLDLHWSLLDSMYYQHVVDTDWFWHTAVPTSVDGIETQILGPEAQLLHLCSHLTIHHHNEGLLWFYDVALHLQTYESVLNWDLLLERAVQYDLVWSLQKIILAVVNEWDVEISQEILDRLLNLEISTNEKRVQERRSMDIRPVAQRFWTDLSEIPSWSSKIRYALLHFFPSPVYMTNRYNIRHSFLLPLYYPYRWFVGLGSVIRLYRLIRQ